MWRETCRRKRDSGRPASRRPPRPTCLDLRTPSPYPPPVSRGRRPHATTRFARDGARSIVRAHLPRRTCPGGGRRQGRDRRHHDHHPRPARCARQAEAHRDREREVRSAPRRPRRAGRRGADAAGGEGAEDDARGAREDRDHGEGRRAERRGGSKALRRQQGRAARPDPRAGEAADRAVPEARQDGRATRRLHQGAESQVQDERRAPAAGRPGRDGRPAREGRQRQGAGHHHHVLGLPVPVLQARGGGRSTR